MQRPESYPDPAKGQYVCNAALCTILVCAYNTTLVHILTIYLCKNYVYTHIHVRRTYTYIFP